MSRSAGSGRFGGDLAGLGVVELVQTLAHGRKTARVTVRSGTRRGEMWFRDGELVHAAADAAFGDLAVYALVEWKTGDFLVEYGVTSSASSITQDATFLVLEGLRRIDERPVVVDVHVEPVPWRESKRAYAALGAVAALAGLVVTASLLDRPEPIVPEAVAAMPAALPVPAPKPAAPRPRPRASKPAPEEPAPLVPSAPESRELEEPVPFTAASVHVAPLAPAVVPAAPDPSRLVVSGKASASGGSVTLLVDGQAVFVHGPLERDAPFETAIDVPAGEHVVVARLEGGAEEGVHEDSVRAGFASGETRLLRITANRAIGSPVKVKLVRPPRNP